MSEIEFKLKTHERVKTDQCECSRHGKVIEMTGDQSERDGVKKIVESFDVDFARNPERWPKDSWRAQNR